MTTKNQRTPLWVRVWHWIVALLFVVLVYTGIVLTFSGRKIALMDYQLATTLHDVSGIGATVVYLLFFVAAVSTGYWRVYLGRWRGLLGRIGRHTKRTVTWTPSKANDRPQGQRRLETSRSFLLVFQQLLCLTSIIVLLPLLIITGLLYLYPETAPETVMAFAGLWPLATAHYVAGLFAVLFLLYHVYIATIAGLRRMIKGG